MKKKKYKNCFAFLTLLAYAVKKRSHEILTSF